MQHLMSVITDSGEPPADAERMTRIGAFNDRLRADGRLIYVNGLGAVADAVTVDARGGSALPAITRGPAIPGADFVAGLWVIDVPVEEAQAIAAEASAVCDRRIEVRAFAGPAPREEP